MEKIPTVLDANNQFVDQELNLAYRNRALNSQIGCWQCLKFSYISNTEMRNCSCTRKSKIVEKL